MWNHLSARNLIDLQRVAAVKQTEREISRLVSEGYWVDADRLLDELIERKREWSKGAYWREDGSEPEPAGH